MEDYALRYTPRRFRKWSEFRVANTAFGAVSFLALEAIGGTIALSYGFTNALSAILIVGVIIFLTGLPISYYAARYGVDMDLLTRGAGFGYLGSTVTSLIYASFTFIFFAIEAAIMAWALNLYIGFPLLWCYLLSALLIIPLVARGITLISRLQLWTQPVWALLLLLPYLAVAWKSPHSFAEFTGFSGQVSGSSGFNWLMFGAAAAVPLSLIVQIGEQVDFLRFLPEPHTGNRWRWWMAVLSSGPGWILPGMFKMLGGAFLTFLAMRHGATANQALEPTQMYLTGYAHLFNSPTWTLAVVTIFVVISQVKINVTNAYAGSLAWSNFFARVTHSHPGRVVWLAFNLVIAMLLMVMGLFQAFERVLGLYSSVAIAWIGALVADLVINKPLKLSPSGIEFKRAYLYDINPVGIGAMALAVMAAVSAHFGVLGKTAQAFAPFLALGISLAASPAIAWLTHGRFYIARVAKPAGILGQSAQCSICENHFEVDDMAHCPAYGGEICSLCCTLESRCHDRCKTDSRAVEQAGQLLKALLPASASRFVNIRVAHYFLVLSFLSVLLLSVLAVVYVYVTGMPYAEGHAALLMATFVKVFVGLFLVVAVLSWWVVLGSESRRMAQDESHQQNQLLMREIDAHQRTDAALQAAKEAAESANQAKTRYVAGMTHELRTPLNSILGYSQILLRHETLPEQTRDALRTIHRSGEHMLALIDGLLDLARIEAGRLRLEPAPLSLPGFLEDLVHMVQPQVRAKGLHFHYSYSGRMPVWVQADAKYLRQILINLLSNAVRFTVKGTVSLHVDCLHEVLRFDVEDTGIGIAPQDVQRIFLPFERGAGGRHHGDPGTGLGLTITALLASLMGGELALARTSKEGSLFSVRLYLREVEDPGPRAEFPQRISGYLGPRRKLLIVDDQPVQRQMLAGMLAPMGFALSEAASGTECLDILHSERPDAVLLDITMDDMDGWETARRIRAAGHVMTIILVSANVFENKAERLRAAGCQAFVGKPVIESELMNTLQRHLGLEWTSAGAPRCPLSGPDALRQVPIRLPGEAHSRALQMLQIGHAQGLLTLFEEIAREQPVIAPTCAELSRFVKQFDFERVRLLLAESAHE
ncbi:MAG: response regulator [Betaproteobacteria bacterium]|nr:response regulator [Betaproteobacteria bacterium]